MVIVEKESRHYYLTRNKNRYRDRSEGDIYLLANKNRPLLPKRGLGPIINNVVDRALQVSPQRRPQTNQGRTKTQVKSI